MAPDGVVMGQSMASNLPRAIGSTPGTHRPPEAQGPRRGHRIHAVAVASGPDAAAAAQLAAVAGALCQAVFGSSGAGLSLPLAGSSDACPRSRASKTRSRSAASSCHALRAKSARRGPAADGSSAARSARSRLTCLAWPLLNRSSHCPPVRVPPNGGDLNPRRRGTPRHFCIALRLVGRAWATCRRWRRCSTLHVIKVQNAGADTAACRAGASDLGRWR